VGPEATSAIVGAVAGGGIAIVGQAVWSLRGERRTRRAAAQLVFAELTLGMAEARAAIATRGAWPNTLGGPRTSSWEQFGPHLMSGKGVEHVGRLAHAYSALEDLAWLAANRHIDEDENYAQLINAIADGLRIVGGIAGLSSAELERRFAESERQDRAFREQLRRDFPDGLPGD
jgi:hypothetical protein